MKKEQREMLETDRIREGELLTLRTPVYKSGEMEFIEKMEQQGWHASKEGGNVKGKKSPWCRNWV
jgi:hypothetical protein